MTASVVVIGDALLDVTARPTRPIRNGADVPAEIRIGCGGQGANLAIRLVRQGIGVELICGLGDDAAATLVADALRVEGVRVSPVRVAATGSVVILLDAAGERSMLSRRSPFAATAPVTEADWTILSGYLFLEVDASALARAVAGSATRRVVVGCAVPEPSRAAWRAVVATASPHLLILNEDEATALAPVDELCAVSAVTGAAAVVVSMAGAHVSVPVPRQRPAVDTTGAGDAFAAAMVGRLLRTAWPPQLAALEAAAAHAIRVAGEVAHASGAQARVAAEAGA